MCKIALIPIDNRPVCYQLPKLIISQAKEHTLLLPDINLLGNLTKSANVKGLFNWIENLNDIDIFVISLDTIAYGGLISSRKSSESFETIVKRINKLFEILKQKQSKIYVLSSIMRISNNNINEEEKEYWKDFGKKIFEYSYNFHKNGITKTDIPSNILEDYLNTRKRNFEINKYYLKLKTEGLIDTLVFSKDDCAKFGLNVLEAEQLQILAKGINNVFIKTGADEIPLVLLSRAINKEKNIKIYPYYTETDGINQISFYEDISVKTSVESQIELSGGIVSDEKDADIILLVNNFIKEQGELVMGVDVPLFNGELKLPDKPYFIADIRNANGSDNNFLQQLFNKNLKNFYGYAGWNTTGNTLGSVLSAALTYFKAEKPSSTSFNELQIVRFLDDWIYQANVRNKLKNNRKNLDVDILKQEMQKHENIIRKKFLVSKKINYYYPWNRFFEIGINIIDCAI